ncbi:MAG: hypothetical protein HN855_10295 [Anaerolineae bacterium]|jgi:hypothetical protein|nr:hypothetical protein [Anaerolineae bacterium]MBT7069510.1 hypothetical protein [Anaerolineae bacterium]MBT7325541.1 hypothetical protein [Anaerolineae bacterium]
MRITRDLLLRLAKENTEERAFNDDTIIAAYVSGSLLREEPLLGGATDIDLVFVHNTPVETPREIKALSPDVHLDIHHRNEKDYHPPRELRGNPWLGYELYDPILLYETKHFFEFNQASLRAGFDEPKSLLKRSYTLLNHARKIWMDLQLNVEVVNPEAITKYLDALLHAANAVAELTGPPLSERRILLDFPARAEAIQHPEFTPALFGLLGGTEIVGSNLDEWLPAWKNFFNFASEASLVDTRVHAARLPYYQKAIEAILASENPLAALYPMLLTWTLAANALPENQISAWQSACQLLGFDTEGFEKRLAAIDHYLDSIEETLEEMLTSHGFEVSEVL